MHIFISLYFLHSHTAAEALSTTKQVELFNIKEFVSAALGVDDESFVVSIASVLEATNIHPSCQTRLAALNVKAVTIPAEYSD